MAPTASLTCFELYSEVLSVSYCHRQPSIINAYDRTSYSASCTAKYIIVASIPGATLLGEKPSQSMIHRAAEIISTPFLPSLDLLHHKQTAKKPKHKPVRDPTHTSHAAFPMLPSVGRCRTTARTTCDPAALARQHRVTWSVAQCCDGVGKSSVCFAVRTKFRTSEESRNSNTTLSTRRSTVRCFFFLSFFHLTTASWRQFGSVADISQEGSSRTKAPRRAAWVPGSGGKRGGSGGKRGVLALGFTQSDETPIPSLFNNFTLCLPHSWNAASSLLPHSSFVRDEKRDQWRRTGVHFVSRVAAR